MFLEKMKWQEIAALDCNKTIVVCCISAMEQHSLHLPMGTDYFIGTELVRRLEERMTDRLLCLPTVWFGASSHHMDFAGTISASVSTMQTILHEIARSVHQHGFSKILFLNSHGGNRALLACAIQEMGEQYPHLKVVGATYWELAKENLSAIRETGFGGMGHACELETSILLATKPEVVDMSKAQRDGTLAESEFSRNEMLSAATVAIYKTMKETTSHGGFGDPSSASAEKGQRMLDAIVPRLVTLCNDMLNERL